MTKLLALLTLLAVGQRPAPPPPSLLEYLGEYGTGTHRIIILESGGKLEAIRGKGQIALDLTPAGRDRFTAEGNPWVFERSGAGKINSLENGATYFRRKDFPEDGAVFSIHPMRPVQALRAQARKLNPPPEKGPFRETDLVDLSTLDAPIHLDIRYATANNFMGSPMYSQSKAFLQRPAAEALARAALHLKAEGFGLLIHDAYRPWYVTWMFWEATPPKQRIFVANPADGSRHNRGCAVDLSMYEIASGRAVTMPSVYDEMTDRAFPNYAGGTSLQRWNRAVLREAMEEQGFEVFHSEWWHFDYKDWKQYAIGNVRFEDVR